MISVRTLYHMLDDFECGAREKKGMFPFNRTHFIQMKMSHFIFVKTSDIYKVNDY